MSFVFFSILGFLYFITCLFFSLDIIYILFFIVSLSQLIVVNRSKLKYESPILWYSTAVYFYHFSSLFLSTVGYYQFENALESSIIYGIIYYSSVTPLFFCRKSSIDNKILDRFDLFFDKKTIFITYLIFMVLTILCNVFFFKSGFSNKGEAILSGGTRFNFIYNWTSLFTLLFLIRYRDSKLFLYAMIFSFILFLFTSLNTGERNVILSYTLSVIILLVVFNKITREKSIVLFVLAGSCIPILQELKTVFAKDLGDIISHTDSIPFYVKLLQGEFRSASRNIDWLLSRESSYDISYGLNLIKDILVGFSPISTGILNSQTWFNNTFFSEVVDTGQGYGFSLYGSFYIAFYWPGLVILSIIYSCFIVIVYNNAKDNIFLFLLSILMITPLIYAQRGDLSVVLSFMIKQNLLPLIIVYLFSRLFRRAFSS